MSRKDYVAWGDVFRSFLLVSISFPFCLRRILLASVLYAFIFVFARLFTTIKRVSMLLRIQMKTENVPLLSHGEVWPLAKWRQRKSGFFLFLNFIIYYLFLLCWSIIALQCWVSFYSFHFDSYSPSSFRGPSLLIPKESFISIPAKGGLSGLHSLLKFPLLSFILLPTSYIYSLSFHTLRPWDPLWNNLITQWVVLWSIPGSIFPFNMNTHLFTSSLARCLILRDSLTQKV